MGPHYSSVRFYPAVLLARDLISRNLAKEALALWTDLSDWEGLSLLHWKSIGVFWLDT